MTLRGSWSSTVLSITSFRTIRRPSRIQGLSELDSYKRGLVNSLTGNPQKSGLDRVPEVETLEELLQDDETSENSTQDCPETMNQTEQKS